MQKFINEFSLAFTSTSTFTTLKTQLDVYENRNYDTI